MTGDLHGIQGNIAPQEEDDSEVTLGSGGPHSDDNEEMMMLPLTVKMSVGTLFSQTLLLAHIYLQDIRVPGALWDLTDLGHWWLLNSLYLSNALSFLQSPMGMLKSSCAQ